jgi:hypothetical protein
MLPHIVTDNNEALLEYISSITDLVVTRLIERGSLTDIYLAEDSNGNQYAIKAIEKSPNSCIYAEIEENQTKFAKLCKTVETDFAIYLCFRILSPFNWNLAIACNWFRSTFVKKCLCFSNN